MFDERYSEFGPLVHWASTAVSVSYVCGRVLCQDRQSADAWSSLQCLQRVKEDDWSREGRPIRRRGGTRQRRLSRRSGVLGSKDRPLLPREAHGGRHTSFPTPQHCRQAA